MARAQVGEMETHLPDKSRDWPAFPSGELSKRFAYIKMDIRLEKHTSSAILGPKALSCPHEVKDVQHTHTQNPLPKQIMQTHRLHAGCFVQ